MEAGEKRSLCVASRPSDVRRAVGFCRRACEGLFSPEDAHSIELAIAEACNNIVEHAYGFRPDQPIWVTVAHEGDRVAFSIEDQSLKAFSPEVVTAPRLEYQSLDDAPEGGWGLFLMRSVMDEVRYGQRGSRNHLRLVKRLTPMAVEPVPQIAQQFDLDELERGRDPEIESLRQQLADNEQSTNDMAAELSTTYESLNLFYSLSRSVNALTDEASLLQVILEQALASSEAHWGVLRLKAGDALVCRATAGSPPVGAVELPLAGDSPEQNVAHTGREEVTFTPDGVPIMCLPIVGLDEFLGTLLLGGTTRPDGFSAGDAKLARALADQAAVSLENHRLYDQVTEAKLIRQEMEIAHRLQQRLYPTDVPAIPGLRLFAEGQAARQVGGDYLALLPAAAGGIDFVVADVMGKGMSAAVFSFLTHVAVRSILRLRRRSSPGQVLTVLNRIMAPDLDRFGMFMTALFGRVDVGNGRVVYASAGHPPPLLVLPDGVTRFLPTHDYMLGVSSACLYRTLTAELTDGMKLVCYTDGLTDIVDDAGTMLGPKPMEETCRRLSSHTITEIGRALMDEALARSPQSGLQDDVAVIGIERLGHRSRRRTGAAACSGQGGRRRA